MSGPENLKFSFPKSRDSTGDNSPVYASGIGLENALGLCNNTFDVPSHTDNMLRQNASFGNIPSANTQSVFPRGPTFGELPGNDLLGMEAAGSFGGGFLTTQSIVQPQGSLGRQSLLCLKIAMINRAWLADPTEQQIQILGLHVDQVKLVGFVRNVNKYDNRCVFILDDGSGVISCDYIVADEPSAFAVKRLQALTETPDIYVKVYGTINLYGKRIPHIRALTIRKIDNPDEIALHDIEVCHLIRKRKDHAAAPIRSDAFKKTTEELSGLAQTMNYSFPPKSGPQPESLISSSHQYASHIVGTEPPTPVPMYSPGQSYSSNPPIYGSFETNLTKGMSSDLMHSTGRMPSQFSGEIQQETLPYVPGISTVVKGILAETNYSINPEGLHRNEILRRVKEILPNPNVTGKLIQNTLDKLEQDAFVCTTSTSDHYRSTNS